jgi:phosphoribosyl 1,2-cyclic phosphate phosphodiesterase
VKVRILGSGTSSGVPRIGNDWGACDPQEPRNRRTRASVLVQSKHTTILVDTSPDMREQLLAANVGALDAVIWTHDHADHTFGIDDLRQVYHMIGRPVKGYARPQTIAALRHRFDYVFEGAHGYPPTVDLQPLPDRLTIGDIAIGVADQPHGGIDTAGLRFSHDDKHAGYATDFHNLTDAMAALYSGLDVWVVDALRRREHPSHPTLEQALSWIGQLQPRRAALIHMDQSMDYRTLCEELPKGVEPGFDGLEFHL